MDTTQDDDRTISINCDNFRMALEGKIRELAEFRCRTMLLNRAKKLDQ
jgi:hypothetical protein